jgi:radical SAM superfamily enzyme YgiQ (UPF0313 family)
VDVLLIAANTERGSMRVLPVGLGMVATAARAAGHRVEWLDLGSTEGAPGAVGAALRARPTEVIGISVRNVDDQCMAAPRFLLDQARQAVVACRAESDAFIVVGGAGYSIFPDAALAYLGADAGVRGDGERAFVALLARLNEGAPLDGLPGVHLPGRAAAPPLRPSLLESFTSPGGDAVRGSDPADPDLLVPVQTRRGCPLRCAYCSTPAIEGRRIRFRPVADAADDLALLARAGFRRIYFVDNTFNLPPSYALELCREMSRRRLDLEWRCILHPFRVGTELVEAMAEAGCVEVSLGFESGCTEVLRGLGKSFTPGDVRRTSDLLAAHGVRRNGFLLVGGPSETLETVRESLAFVDSLYLDALRVTVGIRLYPDTPLARRAVAEGVVAADDDLLEPRFYLAPGLSPHLEGLLAGRA